MQLLELLREAASAASDLEVLLTLVSYNPVRNITIKKATAPAKSDGCFLD